MRNKLVATDLGEVYLDWDKPDIIFDLVGKALYRITFSLQLD